MLDEGVDEDMKQPVQLNYIKLKYNFTPGSKESLEFMTALKHSNHMSLFSSESIKRLVDYKWSRTIWIGYIQALIYVSMLLVMLIGHSTYPNNMFWVTMLWGYLIYLILFFAYGFVS